MTRCQATALMGVLAVALLLRVAGIERRELWWDELVSLSVATGGSFTEPIPGQRDRFTAADFWSAANPVSIAAADLQVDGGNSLLYHEALGLWLRLVPVRPGTIRGFSVLCGVCTVVVAYLLAREFLPAAGAGLAAGLTAVHPLLVRYSQETRSYALATLLVLLGALLLVRAVHRPSTVRWSLVGAVWGAAVLAHYLAGITVAAQGLWLLIRRPERGQWTGITLAGSIAVAIVAAWVVPAGRDGLELLSEINRGYTSIAAGGADGGNYVLPVTGRSLLAGVTQMTAAVTGNLLQRTGLSLAVVGGLLLLFAPLPLLAAGRSDCNRAGIPVLCGLCAFACVAGAVALALRAGHVISFTTSYATFGAPFLCVLLAGIHNLLPPAGRSRRGATLAATSGLAVHVVVLAMSLAAVSADLPTPRPQDAYWRTAQEFRRADGPDVVFLYPSWMDARMTSVYLRGTQTPGQLWAGGTRKLGEPR